MTRNRTRSTSSVKPAIMKSAAVCDWNPRQYRYDLLEAASRLATAALLPTLAHGPSSLEYELDCFIQKPDSRNAQAQKLTQPIHRQFTSFHRRQNCRFIGNAYRGSRNRCVATSSFLISPLSRKQNSPMIHLGPDGDQGIRSIPMTRQ